MRHIFRALEFLSVVILLTRDPTGLLVPYCFQGPRRILCVTAMFARVENKCSMLEKSLFGLLMEHLEL